MIVFLYLVPVHKICRSKRPERNNAGSKVSTRLAATKTTTSVFVLKPIKKNYKVRISVYYRLRYIVEYRQSVLKLNQELISEKTWYFNTPILNEFSTCLFAKLL